MCDAVFFERKIISALAAAEQHQSRLTDEMLAIVGMTSVKIRHFLNNLCGFPGCRYLEVGTWMGATVAAASFRAPGYFVTIDNFSEFECDGDVRQELYANLQWLATDCCISFREGDCWEIADLLPADAFNVYFYDGSHGENEQRDAILRFWRVLQDPFVLIIDDWNMPQVRAGTATSLKQLGHRIQREWSFRTPANGCADTWWNGFYVAVVSKSA